MKKSTMSRLSEYIGTAKGRIALVFLTALIAGLCNIVTPFLIGDAIDIMTALPVDFAALLKIILPLAGLYAGYCLFSYIMNVISVVTAQRIVRKIRSDAFERLQKLPLSYYDTENHGDIVSRFINDCDAVGDGLLQGITQLFSGLITLIGTLIFMLIISPAVTVAVILVTSLSFLITGTITRLSNKYFKAQQTEIGAVSGFAGEYIAGIKTVKAFSREEAAARDFDAINARLYTAGKRATFSGSLTNPSTRFVNNLALITVAVFGAVIGKLSAGELSGFVVYANMFARPLNELTAIATQIMAAYAACGRIFEITGAEPETPDAPDALKLTDPRGEIEFRDVAFSYDKSRSLITDLNLKIGSGGRIAIVGPTGAGKSTVVNLLMRFYDVDSGSITVDGTDIRNITRDSLRAGFGMVLQETWLYGGTVMENIRYGRPDATDDEVIAAAKEAHAHGFIKRLSNGYDTVLGGENGLSEGQRQLLTIARVMLCDPPMLLLDEATSSIDTLTEQRISRAFDKMMEGRTTFIIAHRLSTIENADLILVMDNGHIIEQGTHRELLQKGGFYHRLYNSQFAGEAEA